MCNLLTQMKAILYPSKANKDDSQGVMYIMSRMEWYCRLSGLLVGAAQDNIVSLEFKH